MRRFPRWQNGVEAALQWLERYNALFILSFRFIYGVRNLSSFAMGLSAIRWQRFLSLNLLAAMLWAGCFIAIGYFLGGAFRVVLGDIIHSFSLSLLAVFAAFALAVGLMHRLQKRRQVKIFLADPRAAPRS